MGVSQAMAILGQGRETICRENRSRQTAALAANVCQVTLLAFSIILPRQSDFMTQRIDRILEEAKNNG